MKKIYLVSIKIDAIYILIQFNYTKLREFNKEIVYY